MCNTTSTSKPNKSLTPIILVTTIFIRTCLENKKRTPVWTGMSIRKVNGEVPGTVKVTRTWSETRNRVQGYGTLSLLSGG